MTENDIINREEYASAKQDYSRLINKLEQEHLQLDRDKQEMKDTSETKKKLTKSIASLKV